MSYDVAVVPCADYEPARVLEALKTALAPIGGLDWVCAGMKIAIKANLVGPLKPETAAVTHPAVVAALCRLLIERGAVVTVGDSPGGTWSASWLNVVYNASGIRAVEAEGAALNRDFTQEEVSFPEAAVLKRFPFTSWLRDADAVIDCCKLKTHGFAAMSAAVKNLFGSIPGTRKPEYHYLQQTVRGFADLLIDLNEYIKPRLTVVDAVMCMEGNGPTQGTPRHMGALVCSPSSYAADLVCAGLIGLCPRDVPTVAASIDRGLCPESIEAIRVFGDPDSFALPDFKKLPPRDSSRFRGDHLIGRFLEKAFGSGPRVSLPDCVGCGKCVAVCPNHAVTLRRGRAVIDRRPCIRCFCCQEFCPVGAISVHRPPLARLLGK